MARAGARYPQAEPRAADLARLVAVARPGSIDVRRAAALADAASADVVWLAGGGALARRDLRRAMGWGLGTLPARRLVRRDAPTVPAAASEIEVRRHLRAGAPFVLVRHGAGVVGAVGAAEVEAPRPGLVLTRLLMRASLRGDDAQIWLLKLAGKLGESQGAGVFAVGGFVRDLLLDRRALDVDLAVEGDGVALARRLHEEIGGRLVVHEAFGTASIEGARTPDGTALGRIDVASSRRERYARPGALPEVAPAGILEDLGRRDFAAHAMALSLAPSSFGRLLDPHGGREDVAARRLRPLSPLSFAEDPTRLFRAARYAGRLGFRLDPAGRCALALMTEAGPYPALSGARLRGELEQIARGDGAWRALGWLARSGGLALLDARWAPTAALARRLRAAGALARWAGRAGAPVDPVTVALVALLGDQPAAVRARSLARLGITGAARDALAAMGRGREEAGGIRRTPRPSRLARRLEHAPEALPVAAWLEGDGAVRRRLRWFWTVGRAGRPRLTGSDLLALGVPRGPRVGAALAMLRDGRLDGALQSAAAERDAVRAWLAATKGGRS